MNEHLVNSLLNSSDYYMQVAKNYANLAQQMSKTASCEYTETPNECPCYSARHIVACPEYSNEESEDTMPEIVHVIYNLASVKTVAKRDENGNPVLNPETGKPIRIPVRETPTLTTTVMWDDGTKTVVQNSEADKITVIEKVINAEEVEKNPEVKPIVVKTADEASLENGLVWAIAKKYMYNNINHIKRVVHSAYNTNIERAVAKHKKSMAQKKHLETLANKKPARPSLASVVDKLAEQVGRLETKLS